jgi:pyrroline-5-carboxylate reductase
MDSFTKTSSLAFIGGGNMASAILGGLIRQGMPARQMMVVEPDEGARSRVQADFGIQVMAQAQAPLREAEVVVWAVKPQVFHEAAAAVQPWTGSALHLSVAAGITTDSIGRWLDTERIVRCMPNTPALIGQGMTGLFARPGAHAADRLQAEQIIATTGQFLWVQKEALLDAVTALSGSGPAYVFFFLEAMTEAGIGMGLTREQAHRLAVVTFQGASALAAASSEPPQVLRERVTSKGGTTHAAISHMEQCGMQRGFMQALEAARHRAAEMGAAFG